MAMSLRGYCRTLTERIDCRPAIRITRLTTIERTGRLTKRSVKRILTVLWLRSSLVGGLNLVIDVNCGAVAQLEHAGCHDFFTVLHARKNRNLVATRWPQLHELLAHAPIRIAFRVFQVGNHKNRIAI